MSIYADRPSIRHTTKCGAKRDDDVRLFVYLFVCLSVRKSVCLGNLSSHSLRGSTWRQRGLIVSTPITCLVYKMLIMGSIPATVGLSS